MMLVLLGYPSSTRASEDDWDRTTFHDTPPTETSTGDAAMVLGAQTLPAGTFAAKLAAGHPFLTGGIHVGLSKRIDLLAEAKIPFSEFGKAWLFGGGAKLNLYSQNGRFFSAFKIRAFALLYDDPDNELQAMAPGLMIWPSFVMGMKVKEGCFYGEAGMILYPYIDPGSDRDYIFYSAPIHFGGEIYISDNLHMFINVDIGLGFGFGPVVRGIEGGLLFLL